MDESAFILLFGAFETFLRCALFAACFWSPIASLPYRTEALARAARARSIDLRGRDALVRQYELQARNCSASAAFLVIVAGASVAAIWSGFDPMDSSTEIQKTFAAAFLWLLAAPFLFYGPMALAHPAGLVALGEIEAGADIGQALAAVRAMGFQTFDDERSARFAEEERSAIDAVLPEATAPDRRRSL